MLVDTRVKFDELRGKVLDLKARGWAEPFGFDVESAGPVFSHNGKQKLDPTRHRITGYSMSFVDGSRYYVPLRHPEQHKAGTHTAWDAPTFSTDYAACEPRWKLLRVLTLAEPLVWAHNAKMEIAVLANEGITVRCRLRDSEIACWMAGMEAPGQFPHALKPLARHYLGHDGPDFREMARGRQSNEIPASEIAPYASDDPWLSAQIGERAYKRLVELDCLAHFDLEMRCLKVTEHMERTGVPIDRAYLLAAAERCEAEAARIAEAFEVLTRTTISVPVKVKRPKLCGKCQGRGWTIEAGLNEYEIDQRTCSGSGRKRCVAGIEHYKNGKPVMETVTEMGKAVRGARIGSDAEVSRWLYQELGWWPAAEGIPEVEYGKSVKEEFIRPFAGLPGNRGKACQLRLRYQALRKYSSTYTRSLVALAGQSGDGRLHTSYKQDGTDTSRYSSSMPNQSNLPRSKRQDLPWMKDLPDIRKAFIASPGWDVVIFDFSQIEMRIMAHYSRDPALMACYVPDKDGKTVDVHEMTRLSMQASAAPGMVVQRGDAKITNFSTIYDISPRALANKLAMGTNDWVTYTPDVAEGFIDGFFGAYPKVRAYHDRAVAYAQDHGYATSLTGFKRAITGWNQRKTDKKTGRTYSLFGSCKRQAINGPVQMSAGGILKRALVALYEMWERDGLLNGCVRIQGQTYDEIIVECTATARERVMSDMKFVMESAAPELRVPLVSEGGFGASWSDAK